MAAKKLLLASLGFMSICSAVHAEWSMVKCRIECSQASCGDAEKMKTCEQNCPPNYLNDVCGDVKPQPQKPTVTPSPRTSMGPRALPTLPVTPSTSREQQSALPRPVLPSPVTSAEQTQPQRPVRPMLPPPPETGPDQVQPSHSRPRMERRQVQKFDKPPVLGESGAGKENVEPAVRGLQHSGSKPALHKQPSQHLGAGADKEKAFADQVNALNEGKGVKVKHMIEKLEGAEKLTGALEKRLELMEPLVGTLLVVKEGLKKVLETTGMDKPEVRNDPEHDINYDPVIFSSASGAANTLDGISCEAAILKVKEKSKGVSDKTKSSQLAVFTNQLTELCKLTKDLSRTPQKKVSEAEAFNKVFAQAKRLF